MSLVTTALVEGLAADGAEALSIAIMPHRMRRQERDNIVSLAREMLRGQRGDTICADQDEAGY